MSWWVCALAGALAGFEAGLILAGVQLWQGLMEVGLVGAGPTLPGLGISLVLAVLGGAGIGVVVGYRPGGYAAAVAAGLVLGLLWWVVESLTVLPLLSGVPVTWSADAAEATFGFAVGSLLYGGFTGLGAHLLVAGYSTMRPVTNGERPAGRVRRVVVLGGGFAGISTAQRLERRLSRRADVEVVLVSDSNFLLFTPMLAGVAAGVLEARHISAPVRAACPHTVFHRAVVGGIDPGRRLVHLGPVDAGQPLALGYDHLVLALGAVPNFRGLPGVMEHAWSLKSLDDAVRLRNHILGLLERANVETDPVRRRCQLTFLVAGGGLAGGELVAEVCDLVQDVRRFYPGLDPGELRFVLVHAQDRILPELGSRLAEYARRLGDKGIELLLSATVAEASRDRVVLADGRVLPTRTLVWTAGIRPNPLLSTMGLDLASNGAVVCEPTLQVRGHQDVWAIGDCAAIPDSRDPGRTYPPTAQHAIREGQAAADNIVAALRGRPVRPFRFRTIAILVGLGHQDGVAQVAVECSPGGWRGCCGGACTWRNCPDWRRRFG